MCFVVLLFVVCFYVKNIFRKLILAVIKKVLPLQSNSEIGALAQLVEQRTENPCVPSSILGGTTIRKVVAVSDIFLYYRINFNYSCSAAYSLILRYNKINCSSLLRDIHTGCCPNVEKMIFAIINIFILKY